MKGPVGYFCIEDRTKNDSVWEIAHRYAPQNGLELVASEWDTNCSYQFVIWTSYSFLKKGNLDGRGLIGKIQGMPCRWLCGMHRDLVVKKLRAFSPIVDNPALVRVG